MTLSKSSILIVILGIIAIVTVWYLNIPEHANTTNPAFGGNAYKFENTGTGVVDKNKGLHHIGEKVGDILPLT